MNCTNPIMIKSPNGQGFMEVPCGRCMACRIQKTREWSVRLLHEMYSWKDSVFVTLTYSSDNVPITPCGRMYLRKHDLQCFFKRLRTNCHTPIKYFACGEYGDHTYRPHYHAIIFGLSPSDLDIIRKSWLLGFVSVGSVTPDSVQYVTGYVRKKLNGDKQQKEFGCPICYGFPQFQLQSRGLGLSFAENNTLQIMDSGLTIRGKKVSIPRYYSKKVDLIGTHVSEISAANELKSRFEQSLMKYDNELGNVLRYRSIQRFSSDKQRSDTLKAKNNLFKGKI